MIKNNVLDFISKVLHNVPTGWLNITTHRLDIYNEDGAKTDLLSGFENLYRTNDTRREALDTLPTAYDYIRLGHPLSCVLEWTLGKLNNLAPECVISFSSQTMPILAVLRTNKLSHKKTRIVYDHALPAMLNAELLHHVYGYEFTVEQITDLKSLKPFDGSTIFISGVALNNSPMQVGDTRIDFTVHIQPFLGSTICLHGDDNHHYIPAIQHVRRRESIAMTPQNCLMALHNLTTIKPTVAENNNKTSKKQVQELVNSITVTSTTPLIGSSGLSIQYAIMMGLIHDAIENHPGKNIKFIVPPNCYGGTNDQARRVAAARDVVEILDLPVDGDNNMVQSIDRVLEMVAHHDAVPYIIAEIPTNPRVEVPDLENLKAVLTKKRYTSDGGIAIDPVFILDQTFCPNVQFIGTGKVLENVRTIAYASGSKFPSGGKCTAGYCVGNNKTEPLLEKIATHLALCDNEATALQYDVLAQQLPSMNNRILQAYKNTHDFVNYIKDVLPEAKINFIAPDLPPLGFTPSVFSLDLPTKGDTALEKENYKRALNLKLIHLMINQIPDESKFCVSYGQLKGCYWTVPATSTQGTTKEADKDYIVRASLAPDVDLERHKKVFAQFVEML